MIGTEAVRQPEVGIAKAENPTHKSICFCPHSTLPYFVTGNSRHEQLLYDHLSAYPVCFDSSFFHYTSSVLLSFGLQTDQS